MDRGPKNLALSYVLCLVFGLLGAHHFYLGRRASGLVHLLLTVAGLASASWGIGFVFGGLVLLLCLIDLVRLPGLVRRANGGLN